MRPQSIVIIESPRTKKLFENLYQKGIQLITNIKKNMKNKFMLLIDKLLLRKRSIY